MLLHSTHSIIYQSINLILFFFSLIATLQSSEIRSEFLRLDKSRYIRMRVPKMYKITSESLALDEKQVHEKKRHHLSSVL